MSIQFSISTRVNILGNPSDGNEGDFAPSAVNIRAHAVIDPGDNYILENIQTDYPPVKFQPPELPLPYDENCDLLKVALNQLFAYSKEIKNKISNSSFGHAVNHH